MGSRKKSKKGSDSEDDFQMSDNSDEERIQSDEEPMETEKPKEEEVKTNMKISDMFKPKKDKDVTAMETDSKETSEKPTTESFVKNLPWVEKYRPTDLEDLVSQGHIISTIQKLIENNKLPHLLFYGPPGTGKTSTVLAIARLLYGKNYQSMILELNASDDRGIDVVRQQIKNFADTRNIFSNGLKLIILDEADQMTSAAQAALRRVIEKYTKTTRFCIICNYLNKITPAIQSRCTRFRFGPLQEEQIIERLNYVIDQEKVQIDEQGKKAVMRLGNGDMRRVLNVLQSTAMAYDIVSEENVYSCTGKPLPREIEQILNWLFNQSFETAYQNILQLQTLKGLALADILTEIHLFVIRMDLSQSVRMKLLDRLAETEYRLASGTSEKINLGALVGSFQVAKETILQESKNSQ